MSTDDLLLLIFIIIITAAVILLFTRYILYYIVNNHKKFKWVHITEYTIKKIDFNGFINNVLEFKASIYLFKYKIYTDEFEFNNNHFLSIDVLEENFLKFKDKNVLTETIVEHVIF